MSRPRVQSNRNNDYKTGSVLESESDHECESEWPRLWENDDASTNFDSHSNARHVIQDDADNWEEDPDLDTLDPYEIEASESVSVTGSKEQKGTGNRKGNERSSAATVRKDRRRAVRDDPAARFTTGMVDADRTPAASSSTQVSRKRRHTEIAQEEDSPKQLTDDLLEFGRRQAAQRLIALEQFQSRRKALQEKVKTGPVSQCTRGTRYCKSKHNLE